MINWQPCLASFRTFKSFGWFKLQSHGWGSFYHHQQQQKCIYCNENINIFFFKNLRKYFLFPVMQLQRRWLSQSEELTGTQLGPRDGVYGIHNYNTTRLQDISSSVVWMVNQSNQRNAASTTSTTTIAYNCNIQAMQSIFSTMPSTIYLRSILQMSTY